VPTALFACRLCELYEWFLKKSYSILVFLKLFLINIFVDYLLIVKLAKHKKAMPALKLKGKTWQVCGLLSMCLKA